MMIRDGHGREERFDLRLVNHPPGEVYVRHVAPVVEPDRPVRPYVLSAPAMTAARSRGGTNARKHKNPRPLRDDAALWAALRQTGGNVTHAAELVGRHRGTVRNNLLARIARGTVPADVAWLIAHPRRRPSVQAGTRTHSPETRALISVRIRELRRAQREKVA